MQFHLFSDHRCLRGFISAKSHLSQQCVRHDRLKNVQRKGGLVLRSTCGRTTSACHIQPKVFCVNFAKSGLTFPPSHFRKAHMSTTVSFIYLLFGGEGNCALHSSQGSCLSCHSHVHCCFPSPAHLPKRFQTEMLLSGILEIVSLSSCQNLSVRDTFLLPHDGILMIT